MLGLPMSTYVLLAPDAAPTTIAPVNRAPAAAMPSVESAESPAKENVLAVEPSAAQLESTPSETGAAPAAGGTLLADLSSSLRPWL